MDDEERLGAWHYAVACEERSGESLANAVECEVLEDVGDDVLHRVAGYHGALHALGGGV